MDKEAGKIIEETKLALPQTLEETAHKAEEYFRAARAPNTIKAYTHDFSDFQNRWTRANSAISGMKSGA